MSFSNATELRTAIKGSVSIDGQGRVTVEDATKLRSVLVDRLVRTAVLAGDAPMRDAARWLIRAAAAATGAVPASIQGLYSAVGRKEVGAFTTPAINIRGLTYDVARAVFRAGHRLEAGAVVFELARSEMSYTEQRPAEYTSAVLAAAIKEGHRGPVFIQGDHFQFNAKKHASEPEKETQAIRDLILEAVAAGFYNIDIDSSTLVDLSFSTLDEQQRLNYRRCAEMTAWIRQHEPKGVSISVGGEIGEVGKKNSTPEELRAFMNGYLKEIARLGVSPGISKMSVQTGTSHGGVPMADGRVAEVKLDFDCLEQCSRTARDEFGMAGAVQHGASTLPEELFDHFPKRAACEIHLATGFQNQLYEHPQFPAQLKAEIYEHLKKTCADERKPSDTEEQFLYKTRKKAFGPFKRRLWDLPASTRDAFGADLEKKFELLMRKLAVTGSQANVDRYVKPVIVNQGPPPAPLTS